MHFRVKLDPLKPHILQLLIIPIPDLTDFLFYIRKKKSYAPKLFLAYLFLIQNLQTFIMVIFQNSFDQ